MVGLYYLIVFGICGLLFIASDICDKRKMKKTKWALYTMLSMVVILLV